MAGNLTKRVLTAAILVPAALALVFYGSDHHLSLGFGLIAIGCGWEWSGLSAWKTSARWCYTLSVGILIGSTLVIPLSLKLLIVMGGIWWSFSVVLIVGYQVRPHNWRWLDKPVAHALVGWMILIPAWAALVALHQQPEVNISGLIMVFLLVWGADTGAYFIGRAFGTRQLASNVSPGKTWEGVGGGMLVGLMIGWVGAWWLSIDLGSMLLFMLLCAVTIAMSVVGDLTESLFKRRAGVKDSGTLLPGHGGLLDRVDGLSAAAPVFFLGLGMVL